jgi:eukaryotic-like serine/threonine-protein kinase
VQRCLAKDPEDRWQSAADLAAELKWLAQGSLPGGFPAASGAGESGPVGPDPGTTPGTPDSGAAGMTRAERQPGSAVAPRTARRERLAWGIITVLLLVFIVLLAARTFLEHAQPPRPFTAALLPPLKSAFDTRYPPAVSPDGKKVAFVVVGEDQKSVLFLHDLGSGVLRKLPGTENAAYPFWSPDSRWIGFFTGDKLEKIDSVGGPAVVLCDARDGRGGSWNRDGVILFQPRFSDPLYRIAAGGGKPEPVTKLDEKQFHIAHRWPLFLPDGRHFLFYVVATTNPGASEHSGIYLGSLGSPEIRQVARIDSRMLFSQGQLLYREDTTLMARPFDPVEAKFTGDSLPLAADVVGGAYSWGGAQFGVSDQGVLVYLSGAGQGATELTWFDRSGKNLGQLGKADFYSDLRFSPDGRKVALCIGKDAGDIWVHDLDRDVRTRLTFDPADDASMVWSPDGRRLAFASGRKHTGELYWRNAQGTGKDELFFSSDTQVSTNDWSPDGGIILFTSLSRETGYDGWSWSVKEKKAEPWTEAPMDQLNERFSPNGRWVAYSSAESGRTDVYVQAFPGKTGGRWQVSQAGGDKPAWRRDGKELFFLAADGTLMAVDVRTEGTFELGAPHPLFKAPVRPGSGWSYDVTPDGQRFLMNTLTESDRARQAAAVVLNWTGTLRQ